MVFLSLDLYSDRDRDRSDGLLSLAGSRSGQLIDQRELKGEYQLASLLYIVLSRTVYLSAVSFVRGEGRSLLPLCLILRVWIFNF